MTEEERLIRMDFPEILVPPVMQHPVGSEFDPAANDFVMMSGGAALTPGGNIWIMWAGGGDNTDGYLLFARSFDGGQTWGRPEFMIREGISAHGLRKLTLEGNIWTAPDGTLHLFFNYRLGQFDGRAGTWHAVCRNPDAEHPVWSTPVRQFEGCQLNKPVVLDDGSWLIGVSLWNSDYWREHSFPRMANVYRSIDGGTSWVWQGGYIAPERECDEQQLLAAGGGSLIMFVRNQTGIIQTESSDLGRTWSEGFRPFVSPCSRIFVRRLKSGNVLLVRHDSTERARLTAYLSADNCRSWSGGLLLDERTNVSYPDGFEFEDGRIFIVYDHKRVDGALFAAVFREDEIQAGKLLHSDSCLKKIIYRTQNYSSITSG